MKCSRSPIKSDILVLRLIPNLNFFIIKSELQISFSVLFEESLKSLRHSKNVLEKCVIIIKKRNCEPLKTMFAKSFMAEFMEIPDVINDIPFHSNEKIVD